MPAGVSPIDPTSPVGQLRAIVGDTASTPLVPPVEGRADYAIWGDDALEAAYNAAGENLLRAAGHLYLTLAAGYIQSGKSVRTDDLALNTTNRGSDLLKVAQSFFEQADSADASFETFEVIPFSGRQSPAVCRVEGSPWPSPWSLNG